MPPGITGRWFADYDYTEHIVAAIAMAKERDVNRKLSYEVMREMMKPALLFGELMIVIARKRR